MEETVRTLVRVVLLTTSGLLLMYTVALYYRINRITAQKCVAPGGAATAGEVSGTGSPVMCFALELEPPVAGTESQVSFRVLENIGGVALRGALQTGAVRYCATGGVVYRAAAVERSGERLAVLLSAPTAMGDPEEFPMGTPAASGYSLPTMSDGETSRRVYMTFF